MDFTNDRLEDNLKALEHRLATWRPAIGGLDRDRMLYEAGKAQVTEGHVRFWRLATAALLFVTVGLGGLLAYQTSLLEHERVLVARERARHSSTGTSLITRADESEPSPLPPSSKSADAPVEPLSPTSYFVLTARLANDNHGDSSPDSQIPSDPRRPTTKPGEILPQPRLLSPRDVQRVLDL